MSLKGEINAGHIARNKYSLQVIGLAVPEVTFTSIGSLEEEIEKATLPDRTAASGGQKPPLEVEVRVPAHHDVEISAMETWYIEGQDPVSPTYKKTAVLNQFNIHGVVTRSYTLTGVWNMKRATDDVSFENEGEMATHGYTLSIDEVVMTK